MAPMVAPQPMVARAVACQRSRHGPASREGAEVVRPLISAVAVPNLPSAGRFSYGGISPYWSRASTPLSGAQRPPYRSSSDPPGSVAQRPRDRRRVAQRPSYIGIAPHFCQALQCNLTPPRMCSREAPWSTSCGRGP